MRNAFVSQLEFGKKSFLENVVGVQLFFFEWRNLFYKIGRDLLKGQIGVYHNFSFEKGPL